MTDANKKELAKQVYSGLCKAIEEREWSFMKHDEDLTVTFIVNGDDIPISFIIVVDEDRQMIRVYSPLPFNIPEDKRMELAIATCAVTDKLADGSFDYNIENGVIVFRMTASFLGSNIGDVLFQYMIDCTCVTVDRYNDQFLALGKGLISISDFLNQVYSD